MRRKGRTITARARGSTAKLSPGYIRSQNRSNPRALQSGADNNEGESESQEKGGIGGGGGGGGGREGVA